MFVFWALVVFVGIIWFAVVIAKWVQKSIDAKTEHAHHDDVDLSQVVGHFIGQWIFHFGAIIGSVKFVYRAWTAAPPGSAEKLGWGALLSLIVASGLWLITKVVDRIINGRQAATAARSGMGDKI